MKATGLVKGVTLRAPSHEFASSILTTEALDFLAGLERSFRATRAKLLEARTTRAASRRKGQRLDFLAETANVREGSWRVAAPPDDLRDRRCEITGPTDRKMMINALNSGARVFMADFEDANVPTWPNLLEGHRNLIDAAERTISLTTPQGKEYRLEPKTATLVVRPRGWHLPEKHLLVDGDPMSGSLFDAGLFLFHCAKRLRARGSGPYVYLPKMESHLEARLWAQVFKHAQDALKLPKGAVKTTVLIETLPAAFEMTEILYELRDHSCALNAGRWDYLFSAIKTFHHDPAVVLPDRAQLTMTVPFMRAYTELLVKSCHERDAHAIGGMAAFIPNRRDAAVTEKALARVREDKERESRDGFDGTWVAHPDLVPVALSVFDRVLGKQPNQLARKRDEVRVDAQMLLDFRVPGGRITDASVRSNIEVGVRYIESWLRGVGAVALHDLMEDAATAEIARSQVWQWVHRGTTTEEGTTLSVSTAKKWIAEELRSAQGSAVPGQRFQEAALLFEGLVANSRFEEFLTLPAYEHVP